MPFETIRNWCKRWLETKTLEAEPHTHERSQTSLRRFLEFLGSKADGDLDALKVNDVLRSRDFVAQRFSATNTNLDLKVLRACL